MTLSRSLVRPLAFLPLAFLLSGCALTSVSPTSLAKGVSLHGNVHGGQQPINGAHVYLLAADSGGYGNASDSLLDPAATGNSDSIGAYVLTDASGAWDISGDYTCTPNTQVYLYALSGDPGAGPNSAAGLMAVVGTCPSSGTFATQIPYVSINEVTTVAAAYAMAGYAVDATHVASSGTPLALTGITNAFANAANLADLVSGSALATTPTGIGQVPTDTINLLANIIAACINSTGPGSSPCTTLLGDATSDGTPSGNAPTDTATAMINIAHNPGANMSDLYNLPTASSPFPSAISTQPNDFTLSLVFSGGGISAPGSVSIDAAGNAWIANWDISTVTLLSSLGAPLVNSPLTGNGLTNPSQIAIDNHGNAWVANSNGTAISEFDLNGNVVSGSPFATISGNAPGAVAVDTSGNIWTASAGDNTVTLLTTTGTPTPDYITGDGLNSPNFIAIDTSGNSWVANQSANSVTVFDHTGAPLPNSPIMGDGISSPVAVSIDAAGHAWIGNFDTSTVTVTDITGAPVAGSPFSGGGLSGPIAIAFDGAGNAWIANDSGPGVTELTSAGAAVTGSPFSAIATARFVAVDGSGSVWLAHQGVNRVTEIIGAAVPAVTPIAAALANGAIGARP